MRRYAFYDKMPWGYGHTYLETSVYLGGDIVYPRGLACNESVWMVPNLVNPYG